MFYLCSVNKRQKTALIAAIPGVKATEIIAIIGLPLWIKHHMTRYLFILSLFCLPMLAGTRTAYNPNNPGEVKTIVIDAGHGGHDPGAIGKKSKEKTINLAIALKLGNMIQRSMPGTRVIYTRDRDKFVELFRRAEIANKNKADLFISIHCNASNNKLMKGAETYVMGLHRSKANLAIAKLENASILLENDYQASYEGFDPNSDESYILFNLYQNANLERSMELAGAIQEQLTERVGMKDRGVRQAGFLVLYKTTMPSVLVETGYISNPEDEKFLNSAKGQDYIAAAIYRALRGYEGKTPEPAEKPIVTEIREDTAPAKPDPVVTAQPAAVEFRIQVATSSKPLNENAMVYRTFRTVAVYQHGGLYKYTVGSYRELTRAEEMLAEVKGRGFTDAFIVVFRNNERIPQAEADRILHK
jgi:N-acetylmuramoyl-L-alanine amidase